MDRKDFFKKGFKSLFKTVHDTREMIAEVPVLLKESLVEKVSPEEEANAYRTVPEFSKSKKIRKNIKLPPGALPGEKFEKKCNSCGDCISACPYNVIFPVFIDEKKRTFPFLDTNLTACQLCVDTPCISACSTGALKQLKKNQKIKLGQVKLNFANCLNSQTEDKICSTCKDSCPVESVINFKKNKPTFSKECTGCGICVQMCPTFPKALLVK